LFTNDNFTGTAVTITADNTCLVANSFNDAATSVRVRAAGATTAASTALLAEDKLNIYPNPVNNVLRISSTQSITGATVRILDIMGREVLRTQPANGLINLEKLSAGTYTFQLIRNGQAISQRFVKAAD
jgi:hypothetical protein